jgi:hypothetical protein
LIRAEESDEDEAKESEEEERRLSVVIENKNVLPKFS